MAVLAKSILQSVDAGKEVALKRIQRNLDVELRGVQNCLNLKHVNLISLWDIRTDDAGDSWVVMEYVPGPSLREIIEVHEKGMPGHQIERWYSPIAAGVNYLHDSGLVHRDLKPANIFLDEDEDVIKIGDYGLSKFISSSQGSGQTETVGTFHYMAPEIGKGIYGKGVDIYAMGIVLFEMLTGNVPFRGESSQEIIMKHLTANPDLSEIPFDFQQVIERSLRKDPELRFGSIGEMQEYLPWNENNLAQRPILNSARFDVGTEKTTRENPETVHNQKNAQTPRTLERSVSEAGILFGPLHDSTAGTPNSNNEVLYIENDRARPQQNTAASAPAIATMAAGNEPIATALRTGWGGVADWWNDTSVSTPIKVFVLLLTGFAITANSQWLLPTALGLGFLYLVYYGIRNVILSPIEGELQPKKLSRRQQRQLVQKAMREHLANSDIISKSTSLTGSLLTSAIVCIALNLLGLAITDSLFESAINSWALFTWSSMISVTASWAILVLGKFYETSEGDWLQRRIAMLIVGILIGGVAFVVAGYFNVDFERASSVGFNPLNSTPIVFGNGNNSLLINVLFFASVFGLMRWWRQADPTRGTKLSIWTVGMCLVLAAMFGHILNFVPLLTCIIVVVISIAVQLASPWIAKDQRNAMLAANNKQV